MSWWLFLCCLATDCEPAKLFLINGQTLWTECGWRRHEASVILRYRSQHLLMDSAMVDWTRTKKLQRLISDSNENKTSQSDHAWLEVIHSRQQRSTAKPVILTNKILQEQKKNGLGPSKDTPKTMHLKAPDLEKLKREIRQIRSRQTALRQQLREEITWRQAQHLLGQIDILEKRWREKLYWLQRHQRQPKTRSKTTNSGVRKSQKTSKSIGSLGEKGSRIQDERFPIQRSVGDFLYNQKSCVTLIPCYTYYFQGGGNGQPHLNYRGSRA